MPQPNRRPFSWRREKLTFGGGILSTLHDPLHRVVTSYEASQDATAEQSYNCRIPHLQSPQPWWLTEIADLCEEIFESKTVPPLTFIVLSIYMCTLLFMTLGR